MAERKIEVSATELPQFRRLVEFATEVSVHADAMDDGELRAIVHNCRVDLLQIMDDQPPEGTAG